MPVKVPIPYAPYIKLPQQIIVKLKAPVENLQATPTPLPTTEPTTSQWVKTLATTDFPDITPTPYAVAYIALVYLGGKNTDAAAQTVYWRMIRNGVSVASGSASVSAGYFYTLNAFFFDVVAGDTIEVRLWASSSNVNWDYDAFQVQASRLTTTEALNSPCYTSFDFLVAAPVLTKGAPSASATQNVYIYHLDLNLTSINTPSFYDVLFPKAAYRLYRLHFGDNTSANTASLIASSSYRPYYNRNYVPLNIRLTVWKFW